MPINAKSLSRFYWACAILLAVSAITQDIARAEETIIGVFISWVVLAAVYLTLIGVIVLLLRDADIRSDGDITTILSIALIVVLTLTLLVTYYRTGIVTWYRTWFVSAIILCLVSAYGMQKACERGVLYTKPPPRPIS